jgi:hypothetical protein
MGLNWAAIKNPHEAPPLEQHLIIGCQNQEIRRPIIFKGLILGTYPYFSDDSATEKHW